jgi:aminoglycoside phosphotransferase (APT) family kinase protein
MSNTDRAVDVRKGEELNTVKLEAFLKAHIPGLEGTLTVRQFPSGFSNLTYLLRVGEREMVLRRPPFGANIRSAHDMSREYRVLSGLIKVYPRVPRPLAYCEDESVLGAPFYVMERVAGVILRARPPKDADLPPALMANLSAAAVDNLAEIHGLDYEAAGLGDLGRPGGYVQRQIEGWSRRYRKAQTDEVAEIDAVMAWLAQNPPLESGAALIHNDYKFDNLVLDPDDLTRIRAVLDWEMCTIGDPLMDLGTSLGYWIEAGDPPALLSLLNLTALPGVYDRAQVVARYEQASGRAVGDPLFYYVYGVFKIAVIVQQIYARYRKGLTGDPRFAPLIHVVRACGEIATLALEKGRISYLV